MERLDREKGAEARGQRTPGGFVVFGGSTAVLKDRPSAQQRHPLAVTLRKRLVAEGVLLEGNGLITFTTDTEFSSPSAAATVVHGDAANGLTERKIADGTTLEERDEML
jgi:hypothetical protein